jgi:AraC family transcriptional regulator
VRHAHPHCHVLVKVEAADTQLAVRDATAPPTDGNAVLINAWEPHAYAHDPRRRSTALVGEFRPIRIALRRRMISRAG